MIESMSRSVREVTEPEFRTVAAQRSELDFSNSFERIQLSWTFMESAQSCGLGSGYGPERGLKRRE